MNKLKYRAIWLSMVASIGMISAAVGVENGVASGLMCSGVMMFILLVFTACLLFAGADENE